MLLGFVLFPALAEQCVASLAAQEASSQILPHSSLGTEAVLRFGGERQRSRAFSIWLGPRTVGSPRTLRVGVGNLRLGAGPGAEGATQHSQARWSPTRAAPNTNDSRPRQMSTGAESHPGDSPALGDHTEVSGLFFGLRLVVRPRSWASGRTAQGLHASSSAVGLPSTVGANVESVRPHSSLPEPDRPLLCPVLGKRPKLPHNKTQVQMDFKELVTQTHSFL